MRRSRTLLDKGRGPPARQTQRERTSKKSHEFDAVKKFPLTLIDECSPLLAVVNRAVAEGKIFSIEGDFYSIRNALIKRGWIEKFYSRRNDAVRFIKASIQRHPPVYNECYGIGLLFNTSPGSPAFEVTKAELMSNQLHGMSVPPNFFWTSRRDNPNKAMIVNRFPDVAFSTKVGLCESFKKTNMLQEEGVSRTLAPRCYLLGTGEGKEEFIDDYRLTACFSLLNWILEKNDSVEGVPIDTRQYYYDSWDDLGEWDSYSNVAPVRAVEFAMEKAWNYIQERHHNDIDQEVIVESTKDTVKEWREFIKCYYRIVHNEGKFEYMNEYTLQHVIKTSYHLLQEVEQFRPHMKYDGTENIWIIKPGASSRGNGILITKKMEVVLQYASFTTSHTRQYVVQKYIEKPLLIYDTKFDIRQWFLVTSWEPLTVWIYRDFYLRFCSREYSLTNLDISIHLCNHAVQSKYKNYSNIMLPVEKMWHGYTFKSYLKKTGFPDAWEKIIEPRMREGIIGALLASQDTIANRPNTFELYGADFMITQDYIPWLIEINAFPAMAGSTSVTSGMCRECFEDIIKVVIDRRENSTCYTGKFQLIYKQHEDSLEHDASFDIRVTGNAIPSIDSKKKSVPLKGATQKKKNNMMNSFSKMAESKSVPKPWNFPNKGSANQLTSYLPTSVNSGQKNNDYIDLDLPGEKPSKPGPMKKKIPQKIKFPPI